MSLKDLLVQAKIQKVPGAKYLEELKCCYFCDFCITDLLKWYCKKHNLIFGEHTDCHSVGIQCEFVCDDWEI